MQQKELLVKMGVSLGVAPCDIGFHLAAKTNIIFTASVHLADSLCLSDFVQCKNGYLTFPILETYRNTD